MFRRVVHLTLLTALVSAPAAAQTPAPGALDRFTLPADVTLSRLAK